MSGLGGPSRKNSSGGLTKNSIIKCTIDDLPLENGVLVVSFSHKDNLYQGVLLQLNRERGIPAGISFPKDYFSEDKKAIEPQPQTPAQTPPLNQRNTYFQDTDNGKQYRCLRRVIKTPARFKNSMSLRPVQRPVLCAKCGALCNDKQESSKKETEANTCNTTNSDSEKPKKNGDSKKSPGKTASTKDKLQLTPKQVPASKLSPLECKVSSVAILDDSQDFKYEGVRSLGVVENYWKRPLAKRYETRQANNTEKVKTTKIISKLSSPTTTKCTKSPSSPCSLFRVKKAPQKLSTDKHKANNLILCITKLQNAQEAKFSSSDENSDNSQTEHIPAKSNSHIISSTSPPALLLSVPPMKMKIPVFKTKLKLKRRNSTMPNRLRDKSQSSSNWRTRRVSTMSNPDDNKVLSIDQTPEKELANNNEEYKLENGSYLGADMPTLSHKDDSNQFFSDLSPIESPEAFQDSDDSGQVNSTTTSIKIEPVKTPVIKITFGSSGNGMVVEIPPRNKNNHSEQTSKEVSPDANSKATRKALKRAKKEAKRKLATKSSTNSTSPKMPVLNHGDQVQKTSPVELESLAKPTLTPLTIHLNSSHHLITSSIKDVDETPLIDARTYCRIMLEPGGLVSTATAPAHSTIEPNEPERPSSSKKRKKTKKKKREKVHKENDSSNHSSGESHSFLITAPVTQQLSSPVLKSENIKATPPNKSSGKKRKRSNSSTQLPDKEDSGTLETPNQQHRVCLSLKRVKDQSNAYIPSWNSSFSSDEHGNTSENEEPQDFHFQDTTFELVNESKLPIDSIVAYNHTQSNHEFKKGEIVWGKSTGCPWWWPGKIVEILLRGSSDARAKIAWYSSTKQSYIPFPEVRPFQEYFDQNAKHIKSLRVGTYQQAVREAVLDYRTQD